MATPRKGRLRMDDAPQWVQSLSRQILDKGERPNVQQHISPGWNCSLESDRRPTKWEDRGGHRHSRVATLPVH
jgi:hypothetical protein